MISRTKILALLAVAAGVVAYVKRPVVHPERTGTWHPTDSKRSTR